MEIETESNEGAWIPVTDKGSTCNRNKHRDTPNAQQTSKETGISTAPGFNHPPEETNTPPQKQSTANKTSSPVQVIMNGSLKI